MGSFRKSLNLVNHVLKSRAFTTTPNVSAMPLISPDDLYLDKPKYPPIRDASKSGRKLHARLDKYEEIKCMPLATEKITALIEEPTDAYIFDGSCNYYGTLEFIQHITKTVLVNVLPDYYNNLNTESWLPVLREPLLEAITGEIAKNEWTFPLWKKQDNVDNVDPYMSTLETIMHHLTSVLGSQLEHIVNSQVTAYPRCDAFWYRANEKTDMEMPRKSFNYKRLPRFQLSSKPNFQMRTMDPLPPVLDRNDPFCANSDVPYCKYHPQVFGITRQPKLFPTCVPGFWPGDSCEFPYLTMKSTQFLDEWRKKFGENNIQDGLDQAAIVSSFGWLLASALVQGFTTFNELTYPLVGQTILTNGKQWTFYTYQLNTVTTHPDVDPKTHRNICWTSGQMELYESIEDGQMKGINEHVLKLLLQFFLNPTQTRTDVNLKPYLSEESVTQEVRLENLAKMKTIHENRPHHNRFWLQTPTWHHVYQWNPKARPNPRRKLW